MPNKPSDQDREPDEIGKPHAPAGERARDEERDDGGPRYGGEAWKVADERGDKRFGHARNDDADPSELTKGTGAVDDDEWPGSDSSPQTDASGEAEVAKQTAATDDGDTESSGQRAGFGRGEKPMKPRARAKKTPHSSRR